MFRMNFLVALSTSWNGFSNKIKFCLEFASPVNVILFSCVIDNDMHKKEG